MAPAAAGDTNDGAAFPALTTANIGASYTVTPTFSGSSRAGEICGWIDFDRSGTFTAAEGVCNTFASGATSAPLAWTVPVATTAGPTYARVRITYDTNISTASFNGLFSSGEVEDYLLHIKPVVSVVKALTPAADTGTFNLSIGGTNFATGSRQWRNNESSETVYHTDTPDVTVAGNVSTAAVTGVVLTETGAGGTVFTDYVTTSACMNAAGTAVTVGGTALAPSITIPQSVTGASANGRAQTITCTLTNTRRPCHDHQDLQRRRRPFHLQRRQRLRRGGDDHNGHVRRRCVRRLAHAGGRRDRDNNHRNDPGRLRPGFRHLHRPRRGGTVTPNLATGEIALDAAATAAGSNIACTFTNTKLPTLTLEKISIGTSGRFRLQRR